MSDLYCTLDDIKKKIPEATIIRLTDELNAGVIDQAKVDDAIAEAANEIDFHVGQIVQLPIAEAQRPPILRTLCADMTIYHLYAITREEIPETRKDRYKAAIRMLEKMVERGSIALGLETQPDPPADAGSGIEIEASTPLFSDDILERY